MRALIAATNQNLEAAIKEHTFRKICTPLKVIHIQTPSLRDVPKISRIGNTFCPSIAR